MTARIWHKGPPPHVGWWLANTVCSDELWRWWDGKKWSISCDDSMSDSEAAEEARYASGESTSAVKWTDYWPENARVPRVDPRQQQSDARNAVSLRIIHAQAKMLLESADALGLNVTIERQPLKPLRMGRTEPVVTVWPKRGAA